MLAAAISLLFGVAAVFAASVVLAAIRQGLDAAFALRRELHQLESVSAHRIVRSAPVRRVPVLRVPVSRGPAPRSEASGARAAPAPAMTRGSPIRSAAA